MKKEHCNSRKHENSYEKPDISTQLTIYLITHNPYQAHKKDVKLIKYQKQRNIPALFFKFGRSLCGARKRFC